MANLYLGSRKFVPAFYNTGSEPSPTPTPTPFVDSQYSTYGVVGQPTIEENIAKNFASDSFIFLPERFNPENNPWEIQLKIKTPENAPTRRNLIFGSFRGYMSCGVGGEIKSDERKFGFGFSSSGNSWNIGWIWGTTVIELNTWYYIRLSFTGTQYKFELSTDGINWNLEGSINSSETIFSGIYERLQFGTHDCHFDYYTGEIDLSECYIRIITNPELLTWWKPHTKDGFKYAKVDNHSEYDYSNGTKMWMVQKSNSYDVTKIFSNSRNFNTIGEVTITNNIAKNFNKDKCIWVDPYYLNFTKPWNFHMKIKTGNDVTTRQKLNGDFNGYDYQYPTIEINSWTGTPRLCIHISSNGSNWDIANAVMSAHIVPANAVCWINYGWTGTYYYVDVSVDGTNYFRTITVNSNVSAYNAYHTVAFGNDHFAQHSDAYVPFLGEIDLNEMSIFCDNTLIWTPFSKTNIYDTMSNDWVYGRPIIDMPNNSYGIVRLYV